MNQASANDQQIAFSSQTGRKLNKENLFKMTI